MKTLARVAACSDVQADRTLCITIVGRRLLLCEVGGQWRAVSATCSHYARPLADRLVNGQLICPVHRALFDPASGEVVRGPARRPLLSLPVLEIGGELFIELDEADAQPEPRAAARKEICQ